MLTLGKKHAGFCQWQPRTEAHRHFWVEDFFHRWLTILRIYQETGMSLPFTMSKRKILLVSKFIFPWSWKWLCSWYVENRAVLVQLEVTFSLELPHMKTWSSICLHFLGCDVTVCRFLWGPEVEGTMWLSCTVVKLWFWQQNANLKCDSGITAAAAPSISSAVKYTEIRCASLSFSPSSMLSVPLR